MIGTNWNNSAKESIQDDDDDDDDYDDQSSLLYSNIGKIYILSLSGSK